MVKFNATREEMATITKIVSRARKMGIPGTTMELHMDIRATHSNGCHLRLADLLAADDFNFAHDVAGIVRHIDRETGKLGGCFVPRFADQRAQSE